MTEVNCDLSVCLLNKDGVCTAQTIWLDEEHSCCGGCDDGWIFPEDEEDDETD